MFLAKSKCVTYYFWTLFNRKLYLNLWFEKQNIWLDTYLDPLRWNPLPTSINQFRLHTFIQTFLPSADFTIANLACLEDGATIVELASVPSTTYNFSSSSFLFKKWSVLVTNSVHFLNRTEVVSLLTTHSTNSRFGSRLDLSITYSRNE